MTDLKIQALNIFPVKSLRGIAVNEATLAETGFVNDRIWMLVDDNGKFITQRQQAKMALIDVVVADNNLLVSVGDESVSIPYDQSDCESGGELVSVTIWRDHCTGVLASGEVNRWFSDYLGVSCRLVSFNQAQSRVVDPEYTCDASDVVGFADGFPFLLIGTASLRDLNQRLVAKGESEVPMMRFRPNIVVETDEPYIEDQWKSIQVGDVRLEIVKPCSRCVIPTIDIVTGEKSREPIFTLGEYRKRDGKIFFGQNVIHRYQPGQSIAVGDSVKIIL